LEKRASRNVLKRITIVACAVVLGTILTFVGFLNSPTALGRVAEFFGYEFQVDTVSLSPLLSGSLSNLRIARRDDGLVLLCDNVTAKNSLDLLLKKQIDTLILEKPKLSFRLGKTKSDLSFLKDLPDVRLLDIRNAEISLTWEGSEQKVTLSNFNFTLKDFSPKTGGIASLTTLFSMMTDAKGSIAAQGRITSNARLTAFYPKPYGKGSAELIIEKGTMAADKRNAELSGLSLKSDLAFDSRNDIFSMPNITGTAPKIGAIRGTLKATIRAANPWSADLAVSKVDFANLFVLLRPLLPDDYQEWTMQGTGSAETKLQGTYASEQIALQGTLSLSFGATGFSSPDAAKAAQGVSGSMILKLQYGPKEEKLAFSGQAQINGGEYLWDKFYSNLAGRKASATANGSFFLSDKRLQAQAALDFFQIGTFELALNGTAATWKADAKAIALQNELIVKLLLKDYLDDLSPALKGFSATGVTNLVLHLDHTRVGTEFKGNLSVADMSLKAPANDFSAENLAVHLPVWLFLSPDNKPVERLKDHEDGLITIAGIRKRKVNVERIDIPLYISLNYIRIASPVTVPIFGGNVVLYRYGIDDIPHPAVGFRVALRMESLDLGQLTKELFDNEYVGTLFADTGVLSYRNEQLVGDGQFFVRIFGGEISAKNFFFQKIFTSARKYGGDITFSGISLEQVTQKIPVGHMAGIIDGSLQNFAMEYGQPASFDLELHSVETPGVSQVISMDAIQSISVLGTGADVSINRGITSFFRNFPYSQMGLQCNLRNDVFTVRGTIHSGEKEYIVKRGWLRGVDVVNQNPNNRISFQDMQERVKRIMESGGPSAGVPQMD